MRQTILFTIQIVCWSLLVMCFGVVLASCGTATVPFEDLYATSSAPDQNTPIITFDEGGTVPIIQMPFENGHVSQCTQGVNGQTSHHSSSTMYDVDFDTSNTLAEQLYSPVSGTVYVHTEDASKNFGYHVCIHIGNGMYVIVAHMNDIAVADGEQVVAGQYIGHEGCTGYCSGDHVHVGLHVGDARKMGQFGTSIPVRFLMADKTVNTSATAIESSSVVCGIKALGDKVNGHFYISSFPTLSTSATNSANQPDVVATDVSNYPSNSGSNSSSGSVADVSTAVPQTPSKNSTDDVWVNDFGLDGLQETLMMNASRWADPKSFGQDAFVWGKGGCFDGNLSESDRVHAENGYYHVDFSKFSSSCVGELTLISAVGTDGNPPNSSMTNWNWWQNVSLCSTGSSFCELQNNGTSWEEWMIRISWNPTQGLVPFGNGFTKNGQLK